MLNIKLIIDALALPFGCITTIVIISKNKRNIANILIGLIAYLGGVQTVMFSLLKEFYFDFNINIATFFAKMIYVSIYLMTIPALSFSLFFWRAKYRTLPRFLHIFSFIPALSLTLWMFLESNVVYLIKIFYWDEVYGINNYVKLPFTIYSSIVLLLVLILMITELRIMARRAEYFPTLKRQMNIFTAGFGIGFGGAYLCIFIFQTIFVNTFQPSALFVILVSLGLTLSFSKTLSREKTKLWHGCPKLITEKDGTICCVNTNDGLPVNVKLLDLGAIIERIQIDTEVLKTGQENCTNIVFSNGKGIVCCLTTHNPIKVLNEEVTQDEMELAREMEVMQGNELCSECLHKIIAYRKENKEKSNEEIAIFFLGIRAEEFFGLA
ncbi:MAG: hypothetical protein JXA54_15330 [Candidatus Heimdallarchaeota archaeon]|nr:hypothetical protein [Candidatus Heimdallarchaeota archaeon]